MLEEGALSKAPRSLLLGTDMAGNQKQISQFSQKDAQVGKASGTTSSLSNPEQALGRKWMSRLWGLNRVVDNG